MPCCKDYVIRKPWIRYTDLVGFIYLLHSVPFDQTGRVRDALLQVCKVARRKIAVCKIAGRSSGYNKKLAANRKQVSTMVSVCYC